MVGKRVATPLATGHFDDFGCVTVAFRSKSMNRKPAVDFFDTTARSNETPGFDT
jgi:hypothetical protein